MWCQKLIFDPSQFCRVAEKQEMKGPAPLKLGAGLWVGVVSSGACTLLTPGEDVVRGASGDVLMGAGPFLLEPAPGEACHLPALRLEGAAAEAFQAGLAGPLFADSSLCPAAPELTARLCAAVSAAQASQTAYALLCELAGADEAAQRLPPLVAEAVGAIRSNYMGLYGVEELSEQLGVSKCHLVRMFSAAMGLSPGRYLVKTRIEAAKLHLLEDPDYNLELVASLCGFSGANYFCRVFKRETGMTPAQWRAGASPNAALRPLPARAQEAFV